MKNIANIHNKLYVAICVYIYVETKIGIIQAK